jgi:homoserine O-succinyltransferase
LFRGFDDKFYVPHSRNYYADQESIYAHNSLEVLSASDAAGIFALKSNDNRRFFLTGHAEYDGDTLKNEYIRDLEKGINPAIPENYFPENDPSKPPVVRWKAHAQLLFSNWLNYYVYQTTPYDLDELTEGYTV